MLINELFESGGFWRGVGQSLANRYTPAFDYSTNASSVTGTVKQAAARAGQTLGKVLKKGATSAVQPAQTSSVPAAKDYSQYQTPTVFRRPAAQPVAPTKPAPTVSTQTQPQPQLVKPRVVSQPIRVGNKIYRPGDPMHTRLSQMMQAQQRT